MAAPVMAANELVHTTQKYVLPDESLNLEERDKNRGGKRKRHREWSDTVKYNKVLQQ